MSGTPCRRASNHGKRPVLVCRLGAANGSTVARLTSRGGTGFDNAGFHGVSMCVPKLSVPGMPFQDFRAFLDGLRKQGELIDIDRPVAAK
jgi:hypothetical protein